MIDKETAIKSLEDKISEIQSLLKSSRYSSKHTKWISDTLFLLEDIFGLNSRIFITLKEKGTRDIQLKKVKR